MLNAALTSLKELLELKPEVNLESLLNNSVSKDEIINIRDAINAAPEVNNKGKCEELLNGLGPSTPDKSKDKSKDLCLKWFKMKVYRKLGQDSKAWGIYSNIFYNHGHKSYVSIKPPIYEYVLEEAKLLIIGYKDDQEKDALDLKKLNKKLKNNIKDESQRWAYKRHKAESKFFDPDRIKEPHKIRKMNDLLEEIICHRYRSEYIENLDQIDKSLDPINLEGKSARLFITTERLFQKRVINLISSNKDYPTLGIPIDPRNCYRTANRTLDYGHNESYRIDKTEIKSQHLTGYVDRERLGMSRVRDAGGEDIGSYAKIYEFFKTLTKDETEKELASLIIQYAKKGHQITIDELKGIYHEASQDDIDMLHRCCFLITQKEQTGWHSATYLAAKLHPFCEYWLLGMSVVQARDLISIKEGFMTFKQFFDRGVYPNISKSNVSNLCKEHDNDYKRSVFPLEELTTEQAHRDLKKVYGGDSDTSGDEYYTDSSDTEQSPTKKQKKEDSAPPSIMEGVSITGPSTSRGCGNLPYSVEQTSGFIQLQSAASIVPFNLKTEEHTCRQKSFIDAITKNNVDDTIRLSEQLDPLEPIDDKGSTQLHYAAYCGKTQLVESLLGRVDSNQLHNFINKETQGGTKALDLARKKGNVEIIEILNQALQEAPSSSISGGLSVEGPSTSRGYANL